MLDTSEEIAALKVGKIVSPLLGFPAISLPALVAFYDFQYFVQHRGGRRRGDIYSQGLMDIIAGELGFLSDFLPSDMRDDISFGAVERIRQEYCPTASRQAAIIGIVKALPKPCILLSAQLALRKSEAASLGQMILDVRLHQPVPVLRAVHVTVNEAAREEGIQLHKQWRVPKESIIARVFASGEYAEATEDLSWWTASSGSRLDNCPVLVKARKSWEAVEALIIPTL